MNWRVVRASARLDWQRTRKATAIGLLISAVGVILATTLDSGPNLIGLLLAVGGTAGIGGTAMTGMMERLNGRVAWWRTLPASRTELMLGRLLAAAFRGMLAALGLLSIIPVAASLDATIPTSLVVLACYLLVALVLASLMVVVTAIGMRYRFERVLLVLFGLVLLQSLIFGDRLDAALEVHGIRLGNDLIALLSGTGAAPMLAGAVLLFGVALTGAVAIGVRAIAVAEEQTLVRPPVAVGSLGWQGFRYPAPQGSAISATMMMQLRLSAVGLPQKLLILLVGTIALPFLPKGVALWLSFYLPIIALGIPGRLASHTAAARRDGSLEGWATLPASREQVVAGTVAAAAVLGLLATLSMVGMRLAGGADTTWYVTVGMWGSVTAGTAMATGLAAWFKPVHLVVVGFAVLLLGAAVAMLVTIQLMVDGTPLTLASLPPAVSVATGLVGLLLIAPLGGALYGRGLERYELVRK